MASIQVDTFYLNDICVTGTSQSFSKVYNMAARTDSPTSIPHHDKWLPRWNGNTPEVMSQWNFSPLSFGWLHQVRGYRVLTLRP